MFSDATCLTTRKSSSAGLLFIGQCTIKHVPVAQKAIVLSPAGAELHSATGAICEANGLKPLGGEVGEDFKTVAWVDAQTTVALSCRNGLDKARHPETAGLCIQDFYERGECELSSVGVVILSRPGPRLIGQALRTVMVLLCTAGRTPGQLGALGRVIGCKSRSPVSCMTFCLHRRAPQRAVLRVRARCARGSRGIHRRCVCVCVREGSLASAISRFSAHPSSGCSVVSACSDTFSFWESRRRASSPAACQLSIGDPCGDIRIMADDFLHRAWLASSDLAAPILPSTARPNPLVGMPAMALGRQEGFSGLYDFVYLPVDFARGCGLGYAFVNLVGTSVVPDFRAAFDGYCNWSLRTSKVCQVTWSNRGQGLKANTKRYRNSPVMHDSVRDEFKPCLFSGGLRMPFPAPNRPLRRPCKKA